MARSPPIQTYALKSRYSVTPGQDLLLNLTWIAGTLVFVKPALPTSCGLDCHMWHNLGPLRHQEESTIDQSDGGKDVFVRLHVFGSSH